jgi:membrane protein implicated in regulation of membrane protease activity
VAQVGSGQGRSATPRGQRVLAALAFTLIGLSAVAVVVLLVLRAAGVPNAAFQSGGLLVLQLLPLPGLTIGLLLVIALFVVLAVRRAREQGSQRSRR